MLQVNQLKKSYPLPDGSPLHVLDLASYNLSAGEQAVMIGESGGGKTTFLHAIAGIVAVDSGSISIDSIELTRLSEQGRDRVRAAKLGYVFQTFNLLAGFTALENVRLGMSFGSGRHDLHRAKDLLNKVGLGDRMHHKPGALSVGQQQRVAVARALANRPKLLLADEPTANIDPANQQRIIDLIRECCQEEKIALLLVTHSMSVAKQFERVDRLDEVNQVAKSATASSFPVH